MLKPRPDFHALSGSNLCVIRPRSHRLKASDDGEKLIIAVMSTSELYLVDAETGTATLIDLGGYNISGDGLVGAPLLGLFGRRLWHVVEGG